jgi:hypothetical protein
MKTPLSVSYVKSIIIQTNSNTIIISEPDQVALCSEPFYDYKLYDPNSLRQFEITGILNPKQVEIVKT